MSITKKVILGLCSLGAVGVGYSIANNLCSKPVKATVDIETHKNKSNQNSKKLTIKTKKPAQQAKTKDTPDSSVAKSHNKVAVIKRHHAKASEPQGKVTQPPKAQQSSKTPVTRPQNKPVTKAVTKPKTKLFLTGKKSNHPYDASTIKRANQLFKYHKDWSFSKCLKLAQKG